MKQFCYFFVVLLSVIYILYGKVDGCNTDYGGCQGSNGVGGASGRNCDDNGGDFDGGQDQCGGGNNGESSSAGGGGRGSGGFGSGFGFGGGRYGGGGGGGGGGGSGGGGGCGGGSGGGGGGGGGGGECDQDRFSFSELGNSKSTKQLYLLIL
ncbi:hypothetical protein Peur_041031 [Populus x canadensis]